MAQAGASYNKAFFTNVDTQSVFYVQFNPKEFKLDEKANWKASDEQEADKPLLTYEKGEPTQVAMDLIFDSTDSGSNVYDTYVMPLRDFLTADVDVTDKEGDKMTRPPYCKFTWGRFTFDCVVEKVSATFLMFKPDGTPLRAKVQVGLKERTRNVPGGSDPQVMLTALGSMVSGSRTNASTYTSLPGDTTTSIAQRFKANPQDIALANNIADPMDIPPGTQLVIPANSQLAQVLAKQSLQYTATSWTNDRKLDPFEVPTAQGGATEYVPSALEEDGPVALEYDVDPGSLANAYISYGDYTGTEQGASAFTFGSSGEGAEYGGYGESDFTFGRTEAQTFGDYGESQAIEGGGGADYTGFGDSTAAGSFDNDANPLAQGATAEATGYGGYGDSSGTFGGEGSSGNPNPTSGMADAINTGATPAEQGALSEGVGGASFGDSADAVGEGGGIGAGSYGASASGVGEASGIDAAQSGASVPGVDGVGGGASSGGSGGPGAGGAGAGGAAGQYASGSTAGAGAGQFQSAEKMAEDMQKGEATASGTGAVPGADAYRPGASTSTMSDAAKTSDGMSLGEALERGENAANETDGE